MRKATYFCNSFRLPSSWFGSGKILSELAFQSLKNNINDINIPKSLTYLTGQLMDDYIHDMKIIQRFALLNRKAMMDG